MVIEVESLPRLAATEASIDNIERATTLHSWRLRCGCSRGELLTPAPEMYAAGSTRFPSCGPSGPFSGPSAALQRARAAWSPQRRPPAVSRLKEHVMNTMRNLALRLGLAAATAGFVILETAGRFTP